MARIYLTGSGQTKGYTTGSGIISNPVRILLREKDSKTGSYPTIARTGDPDFSGQYASIFDDSKIINFVAGDLVYPTSLPASSIWVSGGVSTPNVLQGLIAAGTSSKGIADSQVEFTPGENIRPFDESRVYIDNDSEFYQTGTNSSILPGFDQRLGSKTIITLDINPTAATDVFFSTGSSVSNSTSQIGSGLAYFNWNLKKWEMIGDTVNGVRTGSNIDILNPNPVIRSAAPHPAGGIPQFVMSQILYNTARHVGIFHSTHGFPFATQYNSTGSQEFLLTGTLNAPFLLEKATLEWSGSFASYPNATLEDGPLNYQFMLLNISPVNDSVVISQDLTGSASGTPGTFTSRNNSFTVTSVKDLVWSGIVSRYYSALTASAPPLTYERDLNLVKIDNDATGINAVTGTFRVESSAGIYGKNDGLHTMALRGDTENSPLLANKIGFRNFGGYVEGKSFISPIPGINPSGSFTADGTDPNKKYSISFIPSSDIRKNSPYVLLPHHKLVLGFYGVPIQGTQDNNGIWSENSMRNHVTTLSPGLGRLTLYGSLLRNGLPTDSENNQPLTSDAVHEDLHYDNPVYDQFDVEPFETFRNSYSDVIVTGSMLATPLGSSTAINVRKIQGSITAGQAGSTGSLQRFVNLLSESDVFYDTIAPDIGEIDVILGGSGAGTLIEIGSAGAGTSWLSAFPFESRFSSVSRNISQTALVFLDSYPGDSEIAQTSVDKSSADRYFLYGKNPFFRGAVEFFGSSETLSGGFTKRWSNTSFRGLKYGLLNSRQTFTTARFRRDRYGQFRDMLEQSPNAAYLVKNSVEYPIEISFFSRPNSDGTGQLLTDPALTHSQNLSVYATSSLPYFDGIARDRSDNPDVTLQDAKIDVVI